MRWLMLLLALLGSSLVALPLFSDEKKPAKPFGLEKRVPWTTSRVKGSPEPPPPYRTEVAFPKIKFSEPLEIVRAPGSDRLYVAQRYGKIFSFPNDPKAEKAELLLDVGKEQYGLVFHPQFAKNGYFYVVYVQEMDKPKGTRLARFQVKKDDPLHADKSTEKIILEWPSGGHNGGCLRFGPDGFLYIGTGDSSGIADEFQIGQSLEVLPAKLLRIDVDNVPEGKTYGIPKDNPFVNTPGARPEVYAYGLRQPWRYSFDTKTGDLWVGEVGQDLWESVYRIQKGGNYGWSINEGTHPFRPERKKGPTPILPPIVEHPHTEFRSLTGGYIYHGPRLKELAGAYIYGDFDTGRVWMFRYDGKKVSDHRELAKTTLRLVAWGEDHAGELYLLDYMGGQVHRLVANTEKATADFPRRLSETGLFTSTKDLTPAPGLVPYSVNAQLWSDGAYKERFIAIPGDGKIAYNIHTYPQPAPGAPPGFGFPHDTVLVKTFFLDLEPGNPASRRRLETRLLHFQQLGGTEEIGDQYWQGYTYVWNDAQTDAELADIRGLDRTYTIKDAKAPGGKREQVWHFPGRNECIGCHTMPAKFALGVNTLQLNKDHDYGNGRVDNQLRTWEHIGMFTKPLPAPPEKQPRLYDYDDPKVDLDKRARAYLHANCSHCHMKWGGGNAEFQLLATLDLKDLGIVNTRANHGAFDIADAKVLVPGDPKKSLMLARMQRRGLGQMPHIATNVVDPTGVKLIEDWIKQLPTGK